MERRAKKQHAVPQFLLDNFTGGNGNHLFGFDKHKDHQFSVAVKDAAAQNGFYDFELSGKKLSIEQSLSKLEGNASKVITRIVAEESLARLTDDDRNILALFCAVQFVRVQNWRDMRRDIADGMRTTIIDRGGDPEQVEGLGDPSPEEIRVSTIRDVTEAGSLVPSLLNKCWALKKSPSGENLYISDNPLTLHNSRQRTLGLAVPGIEIHLPLSSRLCLWLVCPTIQRQLENMYQEELAQKWKYGHDVDVDLAQTIAGMRECTPISIDSEVVDHLNELQVKFASRFIYGQDGDFALVKEMIRDNPTYKSRMRVTVK